jgi:hypothetical protein
MCVETVAAALSRGIYLEILTCGGSIQLQEWDLGKIPGGGDKENFLVS